MTQIQNGYMQVGISGGVESMSTNNMTDITNDIVSSSIDLSATYSNPLTAAVLVPMGNSNENIVERYGMCREEQDEVRMVVYSSMYSSI